MGWLQTNDQHIFFLIDFQSIKNFDPIFVLNPTIDFAFNVKHEIDHIHPFLGQLISSQRTWL